MPMVDATAHPYAEFERGKTAVVSGKENIAVDLVLAKESVNEVAPAIIALRITRMPKKLHLRVPLSLGNELLEP